MTSASPGRPPFPQPGQRAWMLCLALVTACASTPKAPPAQPAPPPALVGKIRGGGSVAIPRPTPDWARLSLWINAGAIDAPIPAVATLAARWAARHAGAEARVLPDATEIYLDCDLKAQRLARCVRSLAGALSAPAPGEGDVGAMRRRLRQDRLQRGEDPSAWLDREALAALLGPEAVASWDPLAGDDGGTDTVDAEAVGAFLRDHYGPQRALLVAAGDVEDAALAGWTRGLAAARRPAPARPAPPAPAETVRVQAGQRSALVLAMAAPSTEDAARLGRAFQRQHPASGASAFAVGPRALLLLRVPVSGAPWRTLRTAAFDALRLSLEGTQDAPPQRLQQDLASLCRRTGEAWVHAKATQSLTLPWPIGAALSLPGLSPVAPSDEEHAEEQAAQAQSRGEQALAAAREQLSPPIRGRTKDGHAEVTLDNGLTIEVERRAHDATFAASVEVRGGAGLDSAAQHGRAALLSTLAASACAFASRPALNEALRLEGSRMRPLVSAEKWGVLAHGPADHWRQGVDRLLRCVVRPSFRGRDVEDARVALVSQLHASAGAEHAWSAARTLLPTAPGALAPWGSPFSLSGVQVGTLRALHAQSLKAGGMVVRLRVPADVDDAVAFVARRMAQLPEGAAPAPDTPARPAPRPLEGVQLRGRTTIRAWVGLSHSGPIDGDEAAFAVAEQVAYRLDALPGYTLSGLAAGGAPFAWLWMELTVVDPAQLDALPSAVSAALSATKRSLPDAIEPALARAHRRQRRAASDPAEALRARFLAPREPPEDPVASLRALLDAKSTFVIAHPVDP